MASSLELTASSHASISSTAADHSSREGDANNGGGEWRQRAAGSCFCSGQELAKAKPPPYCGSVRTALEAHNIIGWKTFPADCAKYVADYLTGERYGRDADVVINEAIAYAESLKLSGSGKEIWVFDVDDTALSTLPYQANHGYGYLGEATVPIGLQTSTQAFKTSEWKKLVDAAYIIVGNIGDQWSDILGSPYVA
uniref:Acid phosphatase n=1 Tax=Oryza meridionalis TaxID=40149 RepID=A0A0E0DN23_9ORYZ